MTIIEQLEAAQTGSRELSEAVLIALGWERAYWNGAVWRTSADADWRRQSSSPTESVDDAIALVPEGTQWVVAVAHPHEVYLGPFAALIYSSATLLAESWASTPALALCIAVMKARMAGEKNP